MKTTNMIEIQFQDPCSKYLRKSIFFKLKDNSLSDMQIMTKYSYYCRTWKRLSCTGVENYIIESGSNTKTLFKIIRNVSKPVISEENGNDYYGYEVDYLD